MRVFNVQTTHNFFFCDEFPRIKIIGSCNISNLQVLHIKCKKTIYLKYLQLIAVIF